MGFLTEKKRWLVGNWMALLSILVIGLIPFLGFLTTPGGALYASDQLGASAWKFYFDALKTGTIPMWHPYGLGGMPSFDAGFGDGAYPLFLIIGMIMPIKTFISWCFLTHVILAGLCAYYLVNRFFGLGRMLSTALAVAYMFNTNFISHIHAGHTGKFYIMAWLPLSLYLLLRSLKSDAKWYHSGLFALSISLLLSTFHPQFIYYVLMGYFLVWVFRTFWLAKEKRVPLAALTAVRFWAPVMLGIGLMFFLFHPPMQWTKAYGVRGTTEKTTYEHATSWSMHPEETASLIVPEFGGIDKRDYQGGEQQARYWGRNYFKLNSEYPGLSVLFLGILGLVVFRREKRRWFWLWGSIGFLAIIFGLGAHTPLFRAFYALVPGIKNFRAPSMMLFWLATALLVMSADALARLTREDKPLPADKRKAWGKRLYQVGFGIAGALILMGLAPGIVIGIWDGLFGGEPIANIANRAGNQSAFALGALRAGFLLAILVWAARKWLFDETEPRRFGAVLLIVTCADLFWVNSNFIKTYNPAPSLASQPSVDFLKADTSEFRVFGLPGAYERWTMQYHGIETADGWTDNEYKLYREFRGGDYQQNPNFMAGLKQNADGTVSGSPFLDMLNVKYLAYRLQNDAAIHLAPNTSALPRAWFVAHWDTLPETGTLERMKQPGFDPRKLALLSGSGLAPKLPVASAPGNPADTGSAADSARTAAAAPSPSAAAPAAGIKLESKDYNHSVYAVNAPTEGVLVLSELWFPHWRAEVDGKPADLIRTNFAFRGVKLDAGAHKVAFAYHSPWIAFGSRIALLSAALLILLVIGLRYLAPRVPPGPAPETK